MSLEKTQPAAGPHALIVDDRLHRVHRHLILNITEPLPLATAARIANLHPGYFSTYFHARVGMPFLQWVHSVRVGRAKEMLRSSDAPIYEIAYRVGYRDLRTFERAFKRLTSLTPWTWRHDSQPRG